MTCKRKEEAGCVCKEEMVEGDRWFWVIISIGCGGGDGRGGGGEGLP